MVVVFLKKFSIIYFYEAFPNYNSRKCVPEPILTHANPHTFRNKDPTLTYFSKIRTNNPIQKSQNGKVYQVEIIRVKDRGSSTALTTLETPAKTNNGIKVGIFAILFHIPSALPTPFEDSCHLLCKNSA